MSKLIDMSLPFNKNYILSKIGIKFSQIFSIFCFKKTSARNSVKLIIFVTTLFFLVLFFMADLTESFNKSCHLRNVI